jgi:hypothetical protein
MEAAYRAVKNKIAREVKLADNTDNMDLSRISNPTEKDYTRLKEYRLVRAILLGEKVFNHGKPLHHDSYTKHNLAILAFFLFVKKNYPTDIN